LELEKILRKKHIKFFLQACNSRIMPIKSFFKNQKLPKG
jgi:hypothetical protein